MSEQPTDDELAAADEELAFPDLKPANSRNGAWGESITTLRATELEAILQQWEAKADHSGRKGPFNGLPLTGAEIFWLAARVSAGESEQSEIRFAALWILGILDDEEQPDGELGILHLEGAHMSDAFLRGAILCDAHFEGANFWGAHLEGANLDGVHLEDAVLRTAHLEGARFEEAHLERAKLIGAHLEGTFFYKAHLEGADLRGAHLEGATLHQTHLEGANLERAHLEGKRVPADKAARIRRSQQVESDFLDVLSPAYLRLTFFDSATILNDIILNTSEFGAVSVADLRWGDANLAVVDWTTTKRGFLGFGTHVEAIELGEEYAARKETNNASELKDASTRLQEFKDAVRANRQLATVLSQQGLNEDADRFAYKAQTLQREVLRLQGNVGGYAFSLLLWALSGYGYRLWRIAAAYGVVLLTFAVIFLALGVHSHPGESGIQALWDSFLVSLSAIHGRTFFEQLGAWTPAAWFAAVESVVGIVIEGVFVAMLIQRFFSR